MIAPFDIFQTEPDGSMLWRGTAATLEEAHELVCKLADNSQAEFLILSQRTGKKLIIKPDGNGKTGTAEHPPSN